VAQLADTLAQRAVERSVADRHAEYVQEMQRVVDATYRVIARTGSVDPPLRAVIAEAGLNTQAFYRYFQSKDELLLLLLDDGRRRLVGYLEHRMAKASGPPERVRAWVEGVLAQASSSDVAMRTRPFVTNQARLAEQFPEEQQASVDLLVALLTDAVGERGDAEAIYRLTFATLLDHLSRGTRPTSSEREELVGFCLRGARLS
jgi:AcrR family transcriptional regulator